MKNLLSFVSALILSLSFSSLAFAVDPNPPVNPPVKKAEAPVNQEAVNINTADVQTLTKLKGVGEKKAEAIVAWREANGNFKSVEQLLDVKGIGEAILDANRNNIRI